MDITTRIKNSVGGQGALGSAEYVGEGVASLVAIPRAHRRGRWGTGTGTSDGPGGRSTGTWTAAQAAEHLGDPDEQRSCLLVLLGSDESPDAQNVELGCRLGRASSRDLV